MTTRTARCGCGRVEVAVEGDPALVSACHCDFCQKRTGSAFGYQAFFTEHQRVELLGETKVYNGLEVDGVAGEALTPSYHFCTTCGSTVYWTVKDGAGHELLAIAVGNFVDEAFPAPMREYHTRMRHHWLSPVASAQQFQTLPEGTGTRTLE